MKYIISLLAVFALSSCALFTKAEQDVSAVAKSFANDPDKYIQTLAKALQTANGDAKTAEGTLVTIAQDWGLTPVNAQQQALFDKVTSEVAKASGSIPSVNAILSLPHLASIVNPPTSMLKVHTTLRPPHGSIKPESAFDLSVVKN